MIVLTAEEADKIRGRSPKDSGAVLDPVALKDGRFMLGEEVLDDLAHDDVREFLAALPRVPLEKLPTYTEKDAGQPEPIDLTRLSIRAGGVEVLGQRVMQNEEPKGVSRV